MYAFKRKYKFILGLVIIIIISRYDLIFFPEPMDDRVGELFLMHFFGGSYKMEKLDMSLSVVGLLGNIYITLLFCDYLSEDIKEYGELIFTRCSRIRWFAKKVLGTVFYSSLGTILNLYLYIVNAVYTSNCSLDYRDILVILSGISMLMLFIFNSIILINYFSLNYENSIGFILFYSGVIVSTILAMNVQSYNNEMWKRIVSFINPMSNFLISWNYGDFRVCYALAYFLAFSVISTALLWIKVRNMDVLVPKHDRE